MYCLDFSDVLLDKRLIRLRSDCLAALPSERSVLEAMDPFISQIAEASAELARAQFNPEVMICVISLL